MRNTDYIYIVLVLLVFGILALTGCGEKKLTPRLPSEHGLYGHWVPAPGSGATEGVVFMGSGEFRSGGGRVIGMEFGIVDDNTVVINGQDYYYELNGDELIFSWEHNERNRYVRQLHQY